MTEVDSGNYTCEVSAPSSAELGIVKYTVYVKGQSMLKDNSPHSGTLKLMI